MILEHPWSNRESCEIAAESIDEDVNFAPLEDAGSGTEAVEGAGAAETLEEKQRQTRNVVENEAGNQSREMVEKILGALET